MPTWEQWQEHWAKCKTCLYCLLPFPDVYKHQEECFLNPDSDNHK